ncbi:hypothetical protein PWT90_08935 [Aphanocladium album]|nr:hypothetical protein PWT90_08935 [Aphanocladium album]
MSEVAFEPAAAEFNVPGKEWLTTHAKDYAGVASSAVVFESSGTSSSSSPDRVLLVQRAPDDSMPNLWELPGGAVDSSDATILDGCARELREETGLTAARVVRRVTEGSDGEAVTVFTNSRGTKVFCKFVFEVEVREGDEVALDPVEHQGWVWASEDEVVKGVVGGADGIRIPLTAPHVRRLIMEAFRLRKEDKAQ